ncbi:MAG: 2'-5' RNA ligase family protein [Candidatus Micrarchaeota archaeon]
MLVELRLGPEKWKVRSIMQDLGSRMRSIGISEVPHLTLYGSFDGRRRAPDIVRVISAVARQYDSLDFTIDGIKSKPHLHGRGKFIYFDIKPSPELEQFRSDLARGLWKIAPSLNEYDTPSSKHPFLFHISLATRLSETECSRAMNLLTGEGGLNQTLNKLLGMLLGKKPQRAHAHLYLPLTGFRITLLSDRSKIICEYDLALRRLLSRRMALSNHIWRSSLRINRLERGLELSVPDVSSKHQVFVASDLHLSHENIIKYCCRPFSDSAEMDGVLIRNWNYCVKPSDKVYFLGDLSFGRNSRPPEYYLSQLNGDLTLIQGNHDLKIESSVASANVSYKGLDFLLVHDPKDKPKEWNGWTIHGHTHNNELREYPFINGEKKTINVSADVTGFKPVDLDYLVSLNLPSIKRMDLIYSKPVKW